MPAFLQALPCLSEVADWIRDVLERVVEDHHVEVPEALRCSREAALHGIYAELTYGGREIAMRPLVALAMKNRSIASVMT